MQKTSETLDVTQIVSFRIVYVRWKFASLQQMLNNLQQSQKINCICVIFQEKKKRFLNKLFFFHFSHQMKVMPDGELLYIYILYSMNDAYNSMCFCCFVLFLGSLNISTIPPHVPDSINLVGEL